MSGNSLAALELVVVLGLAGWFFFSQSSISRRGSQEQPDATDKASDHEDRDA